MAVHARTYATTLAVAVRRQADTHRDVATLGKLIEEIRDDAGRITKEFWIGLWDIGDDELKRWDAERQWAKNFGAGGDRLEPSIPADDLEALIAAAAKVKHYVDKHVAHADASAVSASVTLTLDEVHETIDVIGELFNKYYGLLTASGWAFLVPAIQYDWKAVFRVPWIGPGTASARPS